MASLVSCGRVGQALTAWIENTTDVAARNALFAALAPLEPVPYQAGLNVADARTTVVYDGNVYLVRAHEMPFTTGATFDPSQWYLLTGITQAQLAAAVQELRDDLAAPDGAGLVGYDPSVTYPAGTVGAAIKADQSNREQIVVFSTGQSNMPQAVAFDWEPEPNLFLWNFDANSQPPDQVGTGFIPQPATSMGPSVVAANNLAKENPHADVYVINIYRGGLGLINWSPAPTDYNFRQAIEGNVPAALAAIGKAQVDYFVFGGAESDANAQSQTIQPDIENWIISWLKTHTWFNAYTPIYIFGFSPYATSAPGNGDFLWRRYNGALRAVVSVDSSSRAYVGLDNFPIQYFDPTGTIPYIHRTPLGYFKSGEKLGQTMLRGVYEPVPRLDDADGLYTPEITAPVQCTATVGYATFTRVGNNIRTNVFVTVDALVAGDIGFDITVPVKVKNFPNNVAGVATSNIGGAGVLTPIANTQAVRLYMRAALGVQTVVLDYSYRGNSSDTLPNSPPGTT